MTKHAQGTFEVKLAPFGDASELGKAAGLGRMTIDKVFSGELSGTSQGEMTTAGNAATGAMAYVALETVTATLEGRAGTFVLRHDAWMLKTAPSGSRLDISVVEASGTGGLAGLTGKMKIDRADGKHAYDFEYALP
jgi:hypothetical protein